MEIYASLSLALMHTEGSSERVREAFSRALDVAAIQGDLAYELRLLSGFFMYYRWNIDINAALDIASRSNEVALKTKDPDDIALAESMLGAAHHLAGNHLVALKHFESGLSHSASGLRFRAGQHLFHHSSLLLVGMARHRGRRKIQSSSHTVSISEPGSSGLFGPGGLSPVRAVHRAVDRARCSLLLEALPCRSDWPARSMAAPSK